MPKKPYKHTDLSTKRCKDCSRFLKLNLIAKNEDADLCYRCWRPRELKRRGVSARYIKAHPTSSATTRERRNAVNR